MIATMCAAAPVPSTSRDAETIEMRGLEQLVRMTLVGGGGTAVAFPHRLSAYIYDGSSSMSGGEKKRRSQRGQCWEEAGAEFYQESYPADVDMEALQRDPTKITTMLPSKQVSRTACAPTQSRRQSVRRRASTRSKRHSMARRGSATTEVHLASLPDLTDESIPNEETTYEEIMRIKAMPVSMGVKREQKAKLKNGPRLRLQGLDAWKWQRRKTWGRFRERTREFFRKFELWHYSLKRIEGANGTGVVSYFLFIKWLMYLNLATFVLVVLFLMAPDQLARGRWDWQHCANGNDSDKMPGIGMLDSELGNDTCCVYQYEVAVNATIRSQEDWLVDWLQDLVQGTGWMERTLMFYGFYTHRSVDLPDPSLPPYNFALAYIMVIAAFFGVSLLAMVRSTARGFKESMLEREGHFYQYCNLVFGGWDFCISGGKAAQFKHRAIYNEIKANLEAERLADERRSRTGLEQTKLAVIRVAANVAVLGILAAAAAAIFYTAVFSRETLESGGMDQVRVFLLEFMTPLTITALNLVVPTLFQHIVKFEKYSPRFVIKVSLVRTVFLRLANLAVLVASLYSKLGLPSEEECHNSRDGVWCWETYLGQQMYKLALLDFVTVTLMTFVVDFARMLVGRKTSSRLAHCLSRQQFDLPKHTLDVVYSQTLCWLGVFYSPLLPLLTAIKCFLFFYVKKFACLINSAPTSTVYRASRSSSMYMVVLLMSFLAAVLPVGYSVATLRPSRSCGPFRGLPTAWDEVVGTISQWPSWLNSALFFFGTAGFAVPLLVVLAAGLYYYHAVAAANQHMVAVLKGQLVLEGHDKQFLLNRLNLVIRKHQEQCQQAGDFPPSTSSQFEG